MTILIKTGKKAKSIDEAVEEIREKPSTRAFDASKYLGKLKKGVDALDYQKKARNERD